MLLMDMVKAIKAGEEITNPASWKNKTIVMNSVSAIVLAVIGIIKWKFPDFVINEIGIDAIVNVIVAVLFAINALMTAITSKKVGVSNGAFSTNKS